MALSGSAFLRLVLTVMVTLHTLVAGVLAGAIASAHASAPPGFVTICTPSGVKTVELSQLDGQPSPAAAVCQCPAGMLCGGGSMAPPADTGDAVRHRLAFDDTGWHHVSTLRLGLPIDLHSGGSRSPPSGAL